MNREIDKIFPDPLLQPTNDSYIDPVIVQCATEWMARLWSGEASDADKAACQQWLTAHPNHECAWNRLQIIDNKLHSVPREIARHIFI